MLTPQWLDELRSRITLSSVIARTLKLHRAGREFKACCPFHDEKTPSFTVNDEKGFYHCFGCGAHGDAIRWLTDRRGLSFLDAVRELAAEAGMDVPAPDPREARRAERLSGLHDVLASAQQWFRANLAAAEGKGARDYLARRGIDAHTIERFGFGYAPEGRNRIARTLAGFDRALLVEAGLLVEAEGKEPYDRFRNRLMLPIEDARGRVIGFGGRILDSPAGDAPKYLNSPDTPLFDKGRTLYNLHRAGPASRRSGRMVVVEGYMDAIALATAGIDEVVAPLGTALTERQIELLWRLVDVPVLCFDGDPAGQRAALRAALRALPLLRPGKSLAFARLPAGLDPDELVRREGAAAIERLLAAPTPLLDLLWESERDAYPLRSPEDKASLKARLGAHAGAITDPDIRALYRRELMDRFSAFAFPPRPQRQRHGWRKDEKPALPRLSAEAADRLRKAMNGGLRDALARAVIAGLARHPREIPRHAETLGALATSDSPLAGAVRALIDAADGLESGAGLSISALAGLAPPAETARFSFLAEGSDPQRAREDLAEAIALLVERPALEAELAEATRRFGQTIDEAAFAEQQRLLKRKLAFERRLGQMAGNRAATTALETCPPGASGNQELD